MTLFFIVGVRLHPTYVTNYESQIGGINLWQNSKIYRKKSRKDT